jgi:REP element-mobilizing transposase RayT
MRVVRETWQLVPLPIYAMVAMPNHWHVVVRPQTADQVSEFFRRLTVMHTMR